MKLSKLTLHGYKTFASRTSFEFTEGITAIVGPNGSGKSNIADALRWVLGEQSFGTLRGKRTSDMIFAGSQKRPRAGMAQAILTLDNRSGWLPIEYSEIEIGRRAYRSGENEYLLNGQKVRLRDVIELLASGGLAHHTYTIISQGLVDQALSIRADERRLLFEGAAGVSQYKLRRAETLRRLQETNHNLERLHDILAEIKPHLNSLKRQANRAKNYEQVATDLKYQLLIWYGYRWQKASEQLLDIRAKSKKTQLLWESGRKNQLSVQGKLDDLRRQVTTTQQVLQAKEEERISLRERAAIERQALAVLQERRDSIKSQLDDLRLEIPAILKQHDSAQVETDSAISELATAQAELDERHAELRSFEANSLTIQSQIKELQSKINKFGLTKTVLQSQIAEAIGKRSLYETQIDKLAGELDSGNRQAEAQAELERTSQAEAAARERLSQVSQTLVEQKKIKENLRDRDSKLQKQHRIQEAERIQLRESVITLQSRIAELHKLKGQDLEIAGDLNIIGRFVDLVSIPELYRLPITAALTHKMATYAVEDSRSFWELIALAEGNSVTVADISLINDLERISIPDHQDAIGWANSLVSSKSEAGALVDLLLGHVLIVGEAMTAYDLAKTLPKGALAVSLDGLVSLGGGLFQFGADPAFFHELSLEENIGRLQKELDEKTLELDSIKHELTKLNAEIADEKIKLAAVNDQLSKTRLKEKEATYQVMEAQRSRELANQQLKFIVQSIEAAREDANRQRNQLQRTIDFLARKEIEAEKLEKDLVIARLEIQELPVAETGAKREQNLQRVEAASTILAGRQAVVDSRRATLNQLDDQLRRRKERQNDLETRWQQLAIDKHSEELERILAESAQVEETINPLREELGSGRKQVAAIEAELARLQRSNHELESQYTQARIDSGQAENQIESLRERITADLGVVAFTNADDMPSQSPLPIAEVVEELPVVESLPADIEETISRYRGQLTRMGPVNLNAPEEFEETTERYEFMKQQVEDLATTKQRLEQVIVDLDHLTSTAFAETVRKVDKEFGTVFQRLFGGGSAQLVLTDPDDLTLSGVDIVARLPRRREQGLALLSGGERSLTATALIFSLLKVSPTPFCVLDEVDAMLDEANVNRFRDLLHELSDKTQFILITHNRGTVQVAETVYGVSMGADSVSQVISIRPEDYLNDHD